MLMCATKCTYRYLCCAAITYCCTVPHAHWLHRTSMADDL